MLTGDSYLFFSFSSLLIFGNNLEGRNPGNGYVSVVLEMHARATRVALHHVYHRMYPPVPLEVRRER